MKTHYPTGARSEYYGRNADYIMLAYSAAAIPGHALTQRAIYTTPVNRASVMTACSVYIYRNVAAAPGGKATAYVEVRQAGVLGTVCIASFVANTVGDQDRAETSGLWWAINPDYYRIMTVDLGTLGSVQYEVACTIVEFDP